MDIAIAGIVAALRITDDRPVAADECMPDLLALVGSILFFAVAWAYIRACDRV